MTHPFVVGGRYQNRRGEYEVIDIHGDEMTIRYDDGETAETDIATAQRIWENIQFDNAAEEDSGRKQPERRPLSRGGSAPRFQGFVEDDFGSLAGSSWRAQDALGGVLSEQLRVATGQPYSSWGVSRRLELHVARADRYQFGDALRRAKLFVYSFDDLAFGFYIEVTGSADKDQFPENFQDWERLKQGLRSGAVMQTVLLEPMSNHGLTLGDYYERDDGGALGCKFQFRDGTLQWWRSIVPEWEPVDVKDMFARLERLPEEAYVNLHLYKVMSRQEAIEKGRSVIGPISNVLRALTPLYQMTVG